MGGEELRNCQMLFTCVYRHVLVCAVCSAIALCLDSAQREWIFFHFITRCSGQYCDLIV